MARKRKVSLTFPIVLFYPLLRVYRQQGHDACRKGLASQSKRRWLVP